MLFDPLLSKDVAQIAIAHTQSNKLLLFGHVSLKARARQTLKGVKLYTFCHFIQENLHFNAKLHSSRQFHLIAVSLCQKT